MSRDRKGRFLTGGNGGPGRPAGSRNSMGSAFLTDFYDDWLRHGKTVLAKVRGSSPGTYLRVAASLVPREIPSQAFDEVSDLTDSELVAALHEEIHGLLGLEKPISTDHGGTPMTEGVESEAARPRRRP